METYTVKIDEYKTIRWYQNGKRHRTDGPAVEYADGTKCWYLNDKELTEKKFNKQTKVATCAGKVVEIDGKKYTLTEIS